MKCGAFVGSEGTHSHFLVGQLQSLPQPKGGCTARLQRRCTFDFVPLDFDSTRRVAGVASLRRLVAAIESADPNDEDEFVEWKGTLDLTTTEAAYHIGRAILAFANRDPAFAARRFEGCGYVVVGVEPGAHEGVTPIDPVDLAAQIDRFVGGVKGPDWEARYVEHAGVQQCCFTSGL
jgi:hypothetical protein